MMLEPSLGLSADSYHRMHAGDGEDAFALPLVSPGTYKTDISTGGRNHPVPIPLVSLIFLSARVTY